MKEIRLLVFPVVLFMTFMSCIKEDELLPDYAPVEVVFSVGATRATDATWTAGDAVGVYVLPADGDDLSAAKEINRKYTVDANGAMTLSDGGATIYYPLDDTGLRFMAYYPYNKLSFDFTDQSTQIKKEAVDFCFHRGTTNYSRTNPATSLAFEHKFSKILMTVKQGDGGPDVNNVVVTLSNMPAAATVDLATMATIDASAITTSGSDLITAYTNTTTSTATEATVEAIIAPHSATAGRVLTFTTSDKARTYELDSSLAFEAGKVYALDVTLKGIGEANCYIVAPNSTLTFPATRAYTSKTGTTLRVNNTTYIGEFAAAVIWSDAAVIDAVSVSGSGNSAKVTVNTTGVSGNAVVKIYKAADANQTPVWSFHIWVTDYDPTVNTWTNNGFTFMDRNLGATEAGLTAAARGLYYQWGRKDPFLGTGVPTVAVSAATGTVAYTIENPDKFITTKSTPFDWYYGSSRNNTLWGHNTTKSVYDPCPEGWRVPVNSGSTSSPWYGVSSQKFDEGTGVNWGTNALYPTTGYLWDDDGNLYFVGINGFYWTASASSVETALCLHLNLEGSFSTSYTYTRAHGFPVRCVQE